jgi:hypothetical protein
LAFEVPEIAPIELNPAFEAVIEALTYSVVAIFVEISLVAGVGAVGVPVNVGEARGAFKAKLVLIVAISDVFVVMLEVAVLTLDVKLVMSDELVVILEVFDNILVSNALSTPVALVTSAVILDVLAFTVVGKLAMVDELTPPTLFTVVAKLPVPVPVISPVNVIV